MKRTKPILILLSILVSTIFAQTHVNSQNQTSGSTGILIDSGKIQFYETKQLRGEETYLIKQLPNGKLTIDARTDLPFAEQDNKPAVTTTLLTARDFTPESFSIKGLTLLEIEEN